MKKILIAVSMLTAWQASYACEGETQLAGMQDASSSANENKLTVPYFLDTLGVNPERIYPKNQYAYYDKTDEKIVQTQRMVMHVQQECRSLAAQIFTDIPQNTTTSCDSSLYRFIAARLMITELITGTIKAREKNERSAYSSSSSRSYLEPKKQENSTSEFPSLSNIIEKMSQQNAPKTGFRSSRDTQPTMEETCWDLLDEKPTEHRSTKKDSEPRETMSSLNEWFTAFRTQQCIGEIASEADDLLLALDERMGNYCSQISADRERVRALIKPAKVAFKQLETLLQTMPTEPIGPTQPSTSAPCSPCNSIEEFLDRLGIKPEKISLEKHSNYYSATNSTAEEALRMLSHLQQECRSLAVAIFNDAHQDATDLEDSLYRFIVARTITEKLFYDVFKAKEKAKERASYSSGFSDGSKKSKKNKPEFPSLKMILKDMARFHCQIKHACCDLLDEQPISGWSNAIANKDEPSNAHETMSSLREWLSTFRSRQHAGEISSNPEDMLLALDARMGNRSLQISTDRERIYAQVAPGVAAFNALAMQFQTKPIEEPVEEPTQPATSQEPQTNRRGDSSSIPFMSGPTFESMSAEPSLEHARQRLQQRHRQEPPPQQAQAAETSARPDTSSSIGSSILGWLWRGSK